MAKGYTCRCDMCGGNDAGKRNRRIYLLNGIKGSERRKHSADKKRTRRILRKRLKREDGE